MLIVIGLNDITDVFHNVYMGYHIKILPLASLSHQQRKGQWIYNALRPVTKDGDRPDDLQDLDKYKAKIADILWNLTDKEFDKIMENYFR